jgi:hypothetical protein
MLLTLGVPRLDLPSIFYAMSLYNLFSMLGLLAVVLLALFATPRHARFLFLPVLLAHVLGIISTAYLESGIFITEQQRTTYATGATGRLEVYLLIFWLGLLFTRLSVPRVRLDISATSDGIHAVSFLAVGFILLLSVANIAVSGTPPFLEEGYTTRFGYLESTKLWFFLSAFGFTATVIPLTLGFVRSVSPNSFAGKLSLVLLLVYLTYLIAVGHKFGGIIFGVFYYFLPIVTENYLRDKSYRFLKARTLCLGTLILVGLLGIVYIHYSSYNLAAEFGVLEFILYRIFALQGHIWWGIDEYVFVSARALPQLSQLLEAMPEMMREVAPADLAHDAIERGVQFAFGFPASAIFFFGPFGGGLVTFISGGVLYLVSHAVIGGIRTKNIFLYVFASYMFVRLYGYLAQGSYDRVISYQFVALLVCWTALLVCFAGRIKYTKQAA